MCDVLTQTVVQLFEKERFYAELILQMNRVLTKSIPTAGVCVQDKIELYINPEYFNSLTPENRLNLLKHECGHILHDHISRAKELEPEVYSKESKDIGESVINHMKHQFLNIAADCAVNSNLHNIPEDWVHPKKFQLEIGQTFEWYNEKLKNNKNAKELQEWDGHNLWYKSLYEKEVLKEKIKQAVNKAAQNTRAAGKMTGEDELLVSKLNYVPRDWRTDLKRFAAKAIETKIESSRKKRNRRYGVSMPGSVKEEVLNLGVAIDTSSSVSDEALNQFMAEIGNIAKYANVTIVEADNEVKNVYTFDPKKTYKIKGRGGTAYQPAFDYFTKETDIDGLIYFGDMDCCETDLKKPKYSVLWAIVGNQNPPVNWGNKIKIEVKQK